uniref:Uncharacterized protein n=1 Tax=Arundo donax TaxID=35708 RepID=A0A0A8XRH1_ARUDO
MSLSLTFSPSPPRLRKVPRRASAVQRTTNHAPPQPSGTRPSSPRPSPSPSVPPRHHPSASSPLAPVPPPPAKLFLFLSTVHLQRHGDANVGHQRECVQVLLGLERPRRHRRRGGAGSGCRGRRLPPGVCGPRPRTPPAPSAAA